MAPEMPKAGSFRAQHVNTALLKHADCKCTYQCVAIKGPAAIWTTAEPYEVLEGKNAVQWFYSRQKHKSEPLSQN